MHPLIKPSFAVVLCGSGPDARRPCGAPCPVSACRSTHSHACTPHTLHVPRPQSSAHSPSDVAFSGRACSAQATVIRRTSAPALRWSTCDFWRQLRRLAALCLPCTTKLLAITRTHIALMNSSFVDGAQKPLRRVLCDSEPLQTCYRNTRIKVDSVERERSAKAAARQLLPPNACIRPNRKRRSQSWVWGRPCAP